MFLAIGYSAVATGGSCTGKLMVGLGNSGVGGNTARGEIVVCQKLGYLQPLRTSLHTISIFLQNSLR